jgi:hypothetical protein
MRTLIAAALISACAPALACGYCIEDQVAATYDHAVVSQALARKHQVAFFHVDGATPSRAVLERAVYSVPGVDRGTARIAADSQTVSFAFDPARATLGGIHARMEKTLAAERVSLMPLEVIDRLGQLKAITAR